MCPLIQLEIDWGGLNSEVIYDKKLMKSDLSEIQGCSAPGLVLRKLIFRKEHRPIIGLAARPQENQVLPKKFYHQT